MRKIKFILTLFFIFITTVTVSGMEELPGLDVSKISGVIERTETGNHLDFSDLFQKAVSGEVNLSPQSIIDIISELFFSEIGSLLSIMRTMIIIAVLSALFKALSASFSQKAVVEMGFYINFIVVVALLLSSFSTCVGIMQSLVDNLCNIMEAAVPLITALMMMNGQIKGAYTFAPLILYMVNLITHLMRDFFSPCIIAGAVLSIANCISERELLTKLCDLVKNSLSYLLKGVAAIFIGVVSLQGLSAPIVNNALTKSAKYAFNAVPVVGSTLKGVVDTMSAWTGALRSGFLVAIVIAITVLAAIPLIKIAAFIFVYKLTAGIIQPICDERIVKAVDGVGSYAAIVLGAAALTVIMLIFTSIIMLSI